MSDNYLKDLFIDEVKGALNKGGGGSGSSGVLSWNDLPDKPFYTEKTFEDIVWDGNADNRPMWGDLGGAFYKVSDEIPTASNLNGAIVRYSNGDQKVISTTSDTQFLELVPGLLAIMDNGAVILIASETEFTAEGQTITIPETGVYMRGWTMGDDDPEALIFKGIVHRIDSKYTERHKLFFSVELNGTSHPGEGVTNNNGVAYTKTNFVDIDGNPVTYEQLCEYGDNVALYPLWSDNNFRYERLVLGMGDRYIPNETVINETYVHYHIINMRNSQDNALHIDILGATNY